MVFHGRHDVGILLREVGFSSAHQPLFSNLVAGKYYSCSRVGFDPGNFAYSMVTAITPSSSPLGSELVFVSWSSAPIS